MNAILNLLGFAILLGVPPLLMVEAWRRYRKYDSSTLVLWRKVFALAGLWAATANVTLSLGAMMYTWLPPIDEHIVGQVILLGFFVSPAAMILVAIGNGKSGWFALPSAALLWCFWWFLGIGQ